MLRSVRWSSTAPQSCFDEQNCDDELTPVPDLDALFAQWQAAPSKASFISGLDLHTASQLVGFIYNRVPRTGGQGRGRNRS